MVEAKFSLAGQLVGHEADVRAIAILPPGRIVSASRDRTIRMWTATGRSYVQTGTFSGHSHFVNALACVGPSEAYTQGLIVSGSMDKTVMVWDPSLDNNSGSSGSSEPMLTLVGHTDTVCALDVHSDVVVSGSWDKTARVWKHGQCVATLAGHEQAVWAVKLLDADGDLILTASADRLIRLFSAYKCTRTFSGHTDVVRSLALHPAHPQHRFFSSGNDGTVREWDLTTGVCIREMHAHTAFVYAVKAVSSEILASCGEDKTLRVWRDGVCVQTLLHPAQSIWCLDVLPNGDIVTGANDGIIRLFTRELSRIASEEELKAYEEQISKSTIHANQVGDVDKSKLPGLEALQNPGKKDAEVIMVRNGNTVEAHQWTQASQQWTKLGEVVDAVGAGRKQVFNGREYDYVFDVDIQEGAPPLKLPYNASDNPYVTAQNFIHEHELPQDYLDQIANFIITNTKGASLGTAPNPDPYTGAGGYVPGMGAAPTVGSTRSGFAENQFNPDPFTESAARPSVPPSTPLVAAKTIPFGKAAYVSFQTANMQIIRTKIMESIPASQLSHAQLDRMLFFCQNSRTASATFESNDAQALKSILDTTADPKRRLPVLDLLRVLVSLSDQVQNGVGGDKLVDWILDVSGLQRLLSGSVSADSAPKELEANWVMGTRALVNALARASSTPSVMQHRASLFKMARTLIPPTPPTGTEKSRHLKLAVMSLALNMAIAMTYQVDDGEFAMELFSYLVPALHSHMKTSPPSSTSVSSSDEEVEWAWRGLGACGQVMFKYEELKQVAGLLDMRVLTGDLGKLGNPRLSALCKEVEALIR